MRKHYQKLMACLLIGCMSFTSLVMLKPIHVEASTSYASVHYMNVHYTMGPYYGQIGRLYINDLLGLCLEPGLEFVNGMYSAHDLDSILLSNQQKEKVMLIDYYGKLMNMEQDNHMYAVVQLYIWEVVTGFSISTLSGELTMIRFNETKRQIDARLASHNTLPSFHNQSFNVDVGSSMELVDTNGILNEFKVSSSDPRVATVTQSGNRLTITAHSQGSVTLNAQKIHDAYVGASTIYKRAGYQTFGVFKLPNPIRYQTTIQTEDPYGVFELTKLDENGRPVHGALFNIDGTQYTTDTQGKISVSGLPVGIVEYFELFVPKPLIVDQTVKQAVIEKGKTTFSTITNAIATGTFTISKYTEDGKPVSGAIFSIMVDNNVITQVMTGENGSVTTDRLPLNHYTIVEVSVPDYLILDPTPIHRELAYVDQNTPVVTASVSVTNRYKPVVSIGAKRIRIDTQKAEDGLVVEGWFTKDIHYDWSHNDFQNTHILVQVVNKTLNSVVSQKTYTAHNFPLFDTYNVNSNTLAPDTHHTYEIIISVNEPHKVTITDPKIDTVGYSASEASFYANSTESSELYVEGLIRTERVLGQTMQSYYERYQISVPILDDLICGRGFHYDVVSEYSNDLNIKSAIELTLIAHNELVDGDWYDRTSSMTSIPLTLSDGQYRVPRVYAHKDVLGTSVSESMYASLSQEAKAQYRDGGHQVLTPLWSSSLGTYHVKLETNQIGVHAFQITFSDSIELYAYLYGWENEHGPSPTITQDQVLVTPIYSLDADNNGMMDSWESTGMPDNWGVESENGTRHLTQGEKDFLNLNNLE